MTTTIVRARVRGPQTPSPVRLPGDIRERVLDLRAAGWSYTQIANATGYSRRHVIRIVKEN